MPGTDAPLDRALLDRIPLTASTVLEIGGWSDRLARAFLARQPDAVWQPRTLAEVEGTADRAVDAVILDGSLDRFVDPWEALAALRRHTAPGGVLLASVANVSHWSVVQQQLQGRWDHARAERLRFFTRRSAIEAVSQAGWTVLDIEPQSPADDAAGAVIDALRPVAARLGIAAADLERDLGAERWLLRAVNGPAPRRLHVAGIGLRKTAGATEARVDYPLAALASLPQARVVWGEGQVRVPGTFKPGIFLLHRFRMMAETLDRQVNAMAAQGWVVVLDWDDDPGQWPKLIATNFDSFRKVHAVSVSTPELAGIVGRWNPVVAVLPNAVPALPDVPAGLPKQGGRLRIFFGAINREGDWSAVLEGIAAAARALQDRVEFVVVHDRAFHDALPEAAREFHPLLPHDAYMRVLESCDLALLPLADTEFNRAKSDLKLIECCAAGVVPICSPTVYGERPEHHAVALFATTPEEWRQAILAAAADLPDLALRRDRGRAYVGASRLHAHHVAARARWYDALVADQPDLERRRRERLGLG